MLTEQLAKVALFGAEWVLYLLILLSVASVALMVERAVQFRRRRNRLRALEERVRELVETGDEAAWRRTVCEDRSAECQLVGRLVAVIDRQGTAPHGLIDSLAGEYREILERYTSFLGTLGSNAPFIGLLGTVIGVIKAFDTLSENLAGGAGAAMADISEALVATGMGLAVAIPAVVAYNQFIRLSDNSAARFTALGQAISTMLAPNGDGHGAAAERGEED
ncbi:MAG: MotA/TolQ/ExbB proton channel family protein [Pseudomonadota bacterium]